MVYFIKSIWGPAGQNGYPKHGKVEFSDKRSAERFSECSGFFLYETGHKEGDKKGARSIFAVGSIKNPKIFKEETTYLAKEEWAKKEFPYYIKITLSKRVEPNHGVPLSKIREILNSPGEDMQRHGGIIKITKTQFDKINSEL